MDSGCHRYEVFVMPKHGKHICLNGGLSKPFWCPSLHMINQVCVVSLLHYQVKLLSHQMKSNHYVNIQLCSKTLHLLSPMLLIYLVVIKKSLKSNVEEVVDYIKNPLYAQRSKYNQRVKNEKI